MHDLHGLCNTQTYAHTHTHSHTNTPTYICFVFFITLVCPQQIRVSWGPYWDLKTLSMMYNHITMTRSSNFFKHCVFQELIWFKLYSRRRNWTVVSVAKYIIMRSCCSRRHFMLHPRLILHSMHTHIYVHLFAWPCIRFINEHLHNI